jgi:hypothetical protein
MGDMSDMILEQGWDDPFGDEDDQPSFVTCRYCKRSGFEWGVVDGKWRLHTPAGKLHVCKVKPLPQPPKSKIITDPVEKARKEGYDAGYRDAMQRAYPDVGM